MTVVSRDVDGGVRVLTLNRPPANAISQQLLADLRTACDAAANDERVRAVVLTGAGRFFSGGLDLNEVVANPQPFASIGSNDGAFALWTLPKPTVAMVNGHAIAGGAVFCLACDLRVAARGNIKIGLNEVAIGLTFPTGALEIAASALTNQHARRALLEAELYDLDAARELGFVDEIVEPAALERVCIERARLLGSRPPTAYARTKQALHHEAVQRVVHESEAQRRATLEVWTLPDTLEKIRQQLSRLSKNTEEGAKR